MTDKEVDVLIDFIFDNDYGYLCDYMCCYHNEFCEKNCEKYKTLNRDCVREYARVKAKECAEVTTEKRDIKYFKDSTKIRVYIDEVTGVNYIVHNYYQDATAITPRLNADGTLYVSGVNGNE